MREEEASMAPAEAAEMQAKASVIQAYARFLWRILLRYPGRTILRKTYFNEWYKKLKVRAES